MSKPIFFSYFPQFHADPLNDRAWGPGFTDWDLIRALPDDLQPQFTPALGHYDPTVPAYLAELVRQLGAVPFPAGLMFYHYHFDGVYALSGFEREWLRQRPGVPFFLCWANETWTKRWIGRPNDVIVEQRHVPDQARIAEHARYLAGFFELPCYHRVDGRPVLLIYNPQSSPTLGRSLSLYRRAFDDLGWAPRIGACISHPQPASQLEGYDFACEFQPRFFFNTRSSSAVARLAARLKATHPKSFEWLGAQRDRLRAASGSRNFHYADYLRGLADGSIERELRVSAGGLPLMRSTFLTWDNTPRYRTRSTRVQHLHSAAKDLHALSSIRSDPGFPLMVNSWNEWSEGAALEPGVREHPLRRAFLAELARTA
jgi:hypothetical protein